MVLVKCYTTNSKNLTVYAFQVLSFNIVLLPLTYKQNIIFEMKMFIEL